MALKPKYIISSIFLFYSFFIYLGQAIVPQSSLNDNRKYQALTLSNQLKILFIEDPETSSAACSFSVGVGSFMDTQTSQGLAHFLQHMLFMGTKDFPNQDQYSEFIRANGGYDNAYTTDSQTNFFFAINNEAFIQGVTRLANFFYGDALIKQSSLQKQMEIVNNQYELNLGSDYRRKWQILKSLGLPPFSKFNVGNKQTLNHSKIRQQLVTFYQKYYSANLISVALTSNFSIEVMKNMLIPILELIPNKNVKLPEANKLFTRKQTSKMVHFQSIRDEAFIQFFWVVQFLQSFQSEHPQEYIKHVLSSEGTNSLFQVLLSKQLGFSIESSHYNIKPHSLITLKIKLNQKEGYNYEKVYNIVFDYVAQMRAKLHVYEELKQKNRIEFQFKTKQSSEDYVTTLSSKMHYCPFEYLLNNSIIFQKYEIAEKTINRIIEQLTTQNLILFHSSKRQLFQPLKQKYFKANYLIDSLPARKKTYINYKSLLKNPYFPIKSTLIQNYTKTTVPLKIGDSVYFLGDSSYNSSKGGIQIRIYCEQDFLFLQFYAIYLKLMLREITYPAQILSTTVRIEANDCIIITIFGFSDTAMRLLQRIGSNIKYMHDGRRGEVLFQLALRMIKQSYVNEQNKSPIQVGQGILRYLLIDKIQNSKQALKKLQRYSYWTTLYRIDKLWRNNYIKWVVVGNFYQEKIVSLIKQVQKTILGRNKFIKIFQYKCLNVKEDIIIEQFISREQVKVSSAIVYYQAGPYTQMFFYLLLILKDYISTPFQTILREKLSAYALDIKIDNTRGILGLKFELASSNYDPKNISDEIKQFNNEYFGALMEKIMDSQNLQALESLKNSIVSRFSQSATLQSLFDEISFEISQNTFHFNRNSEQESQRILKDISVSTIVNFWRKIQTRTVQILLISSKHKKQYKKKNVKAKKISQIKQNGEFWADFYHFK